MKTESRQDKTPVDAIGIHGGFYGNGFLANNQGNRLVGGQTLNIKSP
ncbi:MAG: hypothetical protein IJY42_06220 [Clostridia bacterium]|nr:hypothetical protein [Clostridia bacterium]